MKDKNLPQCSVYIAISLDGFIARKNGSINWLVEATAEVPHGEDFGYNEFMESVDLLLMGRKTYEKVLTFPEWPYKDKKVIVMSKKGIELPSNLTDKVSVTSASPLEILQGLENKNIKRGIVKPANEGKLIEKLAKSYGLTIYETKNKDSRNVSELMRTNDCMIGGTLDGDYHINLNHILEKDAILACLLVLEAMSYSKHNLNVMYNKICEDLTV